MGLDLYLYRLKKEEDIDRGKNDDGDYLIVFTEGDDPNESKNYQEVIKAGFPVYDKDIEYYNLKDIPLLDGYEDKFSHSGFRYDSSGEYAIFYAKENFPYGGEILIDASDIGTTTFKQKVIYHEEQEIGYQRKNMTGDFYDEWCHEGAPSIVTKRSDIERIVSQSKDPDTTKEEFLDPFVEGETFLFISY